jgi:hypothetical protein
MGSFASAVSQATAALEALYKSRAVRAVQAGNYIEASKNFRNAQWSNLWGNVSEGVSNIGNDAAIGTVIGGPIGTAIGAVKGTVDLVTTTTKTVSEWNQISEEQLAVFQGVLDTAKNSADTFYAMRTDEEENRKREELLSYSPERDSDTYLKDIQAKRDDILTDLVNNRTILDSAIAEEDKIAAKLFDLASTSKSIEEMTPYEIQKLADLTAALANAVNTTNKYTDITDKLTKGLNETEKLIKDENKRLKEKALQEEEKAKELYKKEQDAIDNYAKQYSEIDTNAKYSRIRRDYRTVKDASLDAFGNLSKTDATEMKKIIEEQAYYLSSIEYTIERLERSAASGSLNSEQYKELIDLRTSYEKVSESLYNDRELISDKSEILARLSKSKDETNKIYDIANSRFLTDNLGSFSMYFGKTSPSAKTLGETNRLLQKILDSINNQIYTSQVSQFQ